MAIVAVCAIVYANIWGDEMRLHPVLLLGASLLASAAHAADKPVIQPAPAWVAPVPMPPAGEKNDEAPVRLMLTDQQVKIEPGRVTSYSSLALVIQTPQGLAAGNLSFPWDPKTDTLFVHKLAIHREGAVIDVLDSQSFNIVRREPNLENAMLDGVLTANIQPEGLRVGDVLEYAITYERSDPVLKGHVEQIGGTWNGLPIERANLRVEWPSNLSVSVRQSGGLPAVKTVKSGAVTRFEMRLDDVQPIVPPRGAPLRYALGRVVEFTDFRSWADLGALMAPLYQEAAHVPAQGALRDELEKIRAAGADPIRRAEAALALAQDRVRYVALLMGSGGYVPASAEETWSRRFGDCKAKSALLLALLHELGIEAEPVAVNIFAGDGIDQRLPMIGLFNHVLVRARIDGRDYWLDGTRTGDASLARLRTPFYHWGLPLIAKNAALVKMVPAPLDDPDYDLAIDIDAREGLAVPAAVKAMVTLRGDEATETRLALAAMAADARDATLRQYWKDRLDDLDIAKVGATFDQATGTQQLAMEGKLAMDWDDSQYWTDWTRVGFDADFSRTDGTDKAAPYANGHPSYSRTIETIQLPPGFTAQNIFRPAPIDETVAGTEYRRKSSLTDNVFTIERTIRSVAPEFAAQDAPAAQKRLKALSDLPVSIRKPADYRRTRAELEEGLKTTPTDAEGFARRGFNLTELLRFDEAKAAFEEALVLEPGNSGAIYGLSNALYQSGNPEAAIRMVEETAIEAIDAPALAGLRAFFALNKGDLTSAEASFTRMIALAPDNAAGWAGRATARQRTGDLEGALADSAAALKIKPTQPDLNLMRANIFRGLGKPDDAGAEADAMMAANPDNNFAFVAAGNIYAALGRSEEAFKASERALAIKPEAFVYLNRVQLRPAGDLDARLADVEAALALEPDLVNALAAKAQLIFQRGDVAQAVQLYTALLDKDADNRELLHQRGMAYAKMGDKARADSDFAAARAGAVDPAQYNSMCWTKMTMDVALQEALDDCDLALGKQPDFAPFLDSRGFVLLRLGRLDEAIADFDKALAKLPDLASSRFGRALAWARKGEDEKARADREAAIKSDPRVEETFASYGLSL